MLVKRRLPPLKERNCLNWSAVILTLSVIVVTFLLIIYLDRCAKLIGLQYQICRLKETKATLIRQIDGLNLEVQILSSLDRIENLARSKLGMIRAEEKIVLDLSGFKTGMNQPFIALKKIAQP